MKLEIPTLFFDIKDGLDYFGRMYYKHRHQKIFTSYKSFKKFIKFDKLKKCKLTDTRLKKYNEYFSVKETDKDVVLLQKLYREIDEKLLRQIFRTANDSFKRDKEAEKKYGLKVFPMKKYRHHTSYTGYHVNVYHSGRYYFNKFRASYFWGWVSYIENKINDYKFRNEHQEKYTCCKVKKYKTRTVKTFYYLSNIDNLKVGDIVFVPPNDIMAEVLEIGKYFMWETPYPFEELKYINRIATLDEIEKIEKQIREENEQNIEMEEIAKSRIGKKHYCRVVYDDYPNAKKYCYELRVVFDTVKVNDYVVAPNGKKVKVVEEFWSEKDPLDLYNKYFIFEKVK